MEWIFENTGHRAGVFNMEYDELLAQALLRNEGKPTIRVYGWNPPAISLGWNQEMDEIDCAKASADGIDVVRRPTGGRAILHSDEVTYSVTMRVKGKHILAVYDDISRALIAGLEYMGAHVAIEKSQPNFSALYKTPSSVACFSSTGRYEIKWNGKKLVGSAQRRYAAHDGEEIVLQHGSILLGPDHKRMVNYLRHIPDDQRHILLEDLNRKTTDLREVLQRPVLFDEVAEAISMGFQRAWHIEPNLLSKFV